jgi:hypothetical protein
MVNHSNAQSLHPLITRRNPLSLYFLFLSVLFMRLLAPLSVQAFARTTFGNNTPIYWADAEAVLNLQFGCGQTPLPSWGPCWNDAAVDAFSQWNTFASRFRFSRQTPASTTDPCAHTDGVNTASFATSICGLGFGTALAVTVNVGSSATGALIDADTLVDSSRPWSTYSGPLQRSGSGTITAYDFHRVVIHEFGHVLGLAHPDTAGQTVPAIMNSRISDLDGLQTDDITGVNSIYPAMTPIADAYLENPQPGDFVSGITLISGWACNASQIDVQIDSLPIQMAGYGTQRTDTMTVCGDSNNGFGLLVNWGNYGDGAHTLVVFKDGVEFDRRTFFVTTFGTDFLRGVSGAYLLPDFNGHDVTIQWKESLQNFTIIGVE